MQKRTLRQGLRTMALAALGLGGLGTPHPAHAAAPLTQSAAWLPTYGGGPVEIRVFTDYFCEPCREEETELMSLLVLAADRNAARVTFVDYPGHSSSSLYAAYFLAGLNAQAGGDIHLVAKLRASFFEASAAEVSGQKGLEQFLQQKGISFRPLDNRPTFHAFEKLIEDDRILQTPSCTITRGSSKRTLSGKDPILQALQSLLQGK